MNKKEYLVIERLGTDPYNYYDMGISFDSFEAAETAVRKLNNEIPDKHFRDTKYEVWDIKEWEEYKYHGWEDCNVQD